MKIGINGRFLTKLYTGIGQHTYNLFKTMSQMYPEDKFVIVVPERVNINFPENVEIDLVPENFPGTAGMKKTYWEQRQVPAFLLQKKVDLIHIPYPANPWRKLRKPVCVTVHDTIPWTMPAYRKSFLTRLYQNKASHAVTKATHVFTVSEASKQEIIEICKVKPEKVSLSYNAPAAEFFKTASSEQKDSVLRKYNIDKNRPFFLYIGGYDDRKNVTTLVHVFLEKIAPYYEADLVLAGGKVHHSSLYDSYDKLTNPNYKGSVKLKGKLVRTGFIDQEDLPALYQSSFAFIHLSQKEGCNLPVLEAAVSKTPLIISEIRVHKEMIGESALYLEPHDEERLAHIMASLLIDPNNYKKQKERIQRYSCPFMWNKTAETVMEEYKKLI